MTFETKQNSNFFFKLNQQLDTFVFSLLPRRRSKVKKRVYDDKLMLKMYV